MYNEHKRTLTLSRSDMIRVHQALTTVKWNFLEELHNPKNPLSEEMKRNLQSSADMWDRIAREAEAQFDSQDELDHQKA